MKITYAPWGETIAELVEVSRRAEAAGAEVLWVPELHRSATVAAAAIAAGTDHAGIGTAIALAFARSPMITALEALDLDEMSGGRLHLGLGTGVQRLNEDWHNARWGKPVGHLTETVRNIRHFWETCTTGEPVELPGDHEPMRMTGYERPFPVTNTRIPIYLAAMGPAMIRLAGRIGDGWISHELCSPSYLTKRVLPELDEGIAGAEGKAREDVDVVVSACCSIASEPSVARDRVRGLVGFYASVRTYADFFDFHGLGEQQQNVIDAFRSGQGAGRLANSVPDEMVDALTITGERDHVCARIHEYAGLADAVKLSPPSHGIAARDTREAQDQIIQIIAQLTGGTA